MEASWIGIFLGIVALGALFIMMDNPNIYKKAEEETIDSEDEYEESPRYDSKEATEKIERWDDIMLNREIDGDKCPRCKTGLLVFSSSNIGLRPGSRIEYFYCLKCKMDTNAKRAGELR